MHVACWVLKATNTHVIFDAFPLRRWLPEHASVLRYTYADCHVKFATVSDSNIVQCNGVRLCCAGVSCKTNLLQSIERKCYSRTKIEIVVSDEH